MLLSLIVNNFIRFRLCLNTDNKKLKQKTRKIVSNLVSHIPIGTLSVVGVSRNVSP